MNGVNYGQAGNKDTPTFNEAARYRDDPRYFLPAPLNRVGSLSLFLSLSLSLLFLSLFLLSDGSRILSRMGEM